METTPTAAAASPTPARLAGTYDRLFFGGVAIAMALTVLVGFGPTYYLRFFSGGPTNTISGKPFNVVVHLHAALFTSWVILFIVQTTLIASRRVAVHRKMGVVGATLAAAMVAAGLTVAIKSAVRGSAPPGIDPLAFMAVPVFDMILFSTFIVAALLKRRDRESHKRLMLMAYVSLLAAPIARVPGVLPLGPFGYFGLAFVFALAGMAYDLVTRRRVHRVYLWAGALFLISVPARLMISGTGAWRSIAQWLTS